MENMRVVIPSKARPKFPSSKVFHKPIVFVEPQDWKIYAENNNGINIVQMNADDKGISFARNYILDFMKDEIFCMADDDITAIYKKEGSKFIKLLDLLDTEEFLNDMEGIMINSKIAMLGLPTKAYSWCKDKVMDFNTKLMNLIFINGKLLYPLRYDENIKHGEDVDMFIQIVRSGRTNAMYNLFTYTNAKSGKLTGGCQLIRTDGDMIRSLSYMNLKWGEGTVKGKMKNGILCHTVKIK